VTATNGSDAPLLQVNGSRPALCVTMMAIDSNSTQPYRRPARTAVGWTDPGGRPAVRTTRERDLRRTDRLTGVTGGLSMSYDRADNGGKGIGAKLTDSASIPWRGNVGRWDGHDVA